MVFRGDVHRAHRRIAAIDAIVTDHATTGGRVWSLETDPEELTSPLPAGPSSAVRNRPPRPAVPFWPVVRPLFLVTGHRSPFPPTPSTAVQLNQNSPIDLGSSCSTRIRRSLNFQKSRFLKKYVAPVWETSTYYCVLSLFVGYRSVLVVNKKKKHKLTWIELEVGIRQFCICSYNVVGT